MNATFYFAEPNLLPDQSWSLVSSIQLFLIIPKLFCFFPVSSWASLSLSSFLTFWRSRASAAFQVEEVTGNVQPILWLSQKETRFGLQFERLQETSTDFDVGVGLSDLLPAKVTWLLDFTLIFWAFKNMAGLFFQSLGNNSNMANDGGAFEPCDLFLEILFFFNEEVLSHFGDSFLTWAAISSKKLEVPVFKGRKKTSRATTFF